MANRIEQARAAVDACIREAYLRAVAAGELPEGAEIRGSVEQPEGRRQRRLCRKPCHGIGQDHAHGAAQDR